MPLSNPSSAAPVATPAANSEPALRERISLADQELMLAMARVIKQLEERQVFLRDQLIAHKADTAASLSRLREDARRAHERELATGGWGARITKKLGSVRRTLRRYKVLVRQHRAHLMYIARDDLPKRWPKRWTDADKEIMAECLLPIANGIGDKLNANMSRSFAMLVNDIESGVLRAQTPAPAP